MAIAKLSRSAQMRIKRAEGMKVGDIARLFGTTYHNAYSAVVVRAASSARVILPPTAPGSTVGSPASSYAAGQRYRGRSKPFGEMRPEELAGVEEALLLQAYKVRGKAKAEKDDWRAVRDELDRRDPEGAWLDRVPN